MRSRRSLVRCLVALPAIAAFLAHAPAFAGIVDPGPPNATVPALLRVVGSDGGGHPDPLGRYEVVVRDLANNPIQGSVVALDFTYCTDLRLCANPLDPDAVVDCAWPRISKVTDANGRATFHVLGYSAVLPTTPGPTGYSLRVYADGVLVGYAIVAIYDLTGGAGTGASDLAAWLEEYFNGTGVSRGDYDGNGALSGSDLSGWLALFFASGSVSNCAAASCP